MSQKFLDLAGLTVYDGKIKEWIKSSTVDITNDEIRALFVTVAEGPADNEIWYTSSDGNIMSPHNIYVFGANIVSNTYENNRGVITFDGDVTSIGARSFSNCPGLTSIAIPNSVARIGAYAFEFCSGLTSITIPNSVTSIETMGFFECKSLTSISIPNSVTSIGEWAFKFCKSLNSITYEGTQEQWNAITKGELWNDGVPATHVQCSDGQVTL